MAGAWKPGTGKGDRDAGPPALSGMRARTGVCRVARAYSSPADREGGGKRDRTRDDVVMVVDGSRILGRGRDVVVDFSLTDGRGCDITGASLRSGERIALAVRWPAHPWRLPWALHGKDRGADGDAGQVGY